MVNLLIRKLTAEKIATIIQATYIPPIKNRFYINEQAERERKRRKERDRRNVPIITRNHKRQKVKGSSYELFPNITRKNRKLHPFLTSKLLQPLLNALNAQK